MDEEIEAVETPVEAETPEEVETPAEVAEETTDAVVDEVEVAAE